jgi:hypothetical protein
MRIVNWVDIEDQLFNLLNTDYYRKNSGINSPRDYARKCVIRAQGTALPAYSTEVTVLELQHPARSDRPVRLVRGFDSTHSGSELGAWWIDYNLFERFRRATSRLPPALREEKIKAFMRARSAVSHDWSNMAGIAQLELPLGSRSPALAGKAHYQRLVTDPKHPEYVPSVFLMGGDLQFYVCIRDPGWIRPLAA